MKSLRFIAVGSAVVSALLFLTLLASTPRRDSLVQLSRQPAHRMELAWTGKYMDPLPEEQDLGESGEDVIMCLEYCLRGLHTMFTSDSLFPVLLEPCIWCNQLRTNANLSVSSGSWNVYVIVCGYWLCVVASMPRVLTCACALPTTRTKVF
jgi:hypothetical protein